MKLVVLKGGDEAVPLAQCARSAHAPTRLAGAVAVSGDGRNWVVLNISPSVADQLATDARLLRHVGLSDAAVRVVVLTDAKMDHVTGLLSLRDGAPIHLYATPAVFEELTHSLPVLPTLQHYCGVQWHVIPVAGECRDAVFQVEGQPNLEFTAVATDEPVPPHITRAASPAVGETIALAVRDLQTGQRFFCANSLHDAGEVAVAWMREANCVLVGDLDSAMGDFDGLPSRRLLTLARAGRSARPRGNSGRSAFELVPNRMEIEL